MRYSFARQSEDEVRPAPTAAGKLRRIAFFPLKCDLFTLYRVQKLATLFGSHRRFTTDLPRIKFANNLSVIK